MVAAFCGIQNHRNHDRDEAHIDRVGFRPYIVTGVVLTLALILGLYGIVQVILT
jgi:hypothetical protein